MFLPISTNFTSTLEIPLPSPVLKNGSFGCSSPVEPRAFTFDIHPAYTRFTPNDSEQRLHPPYYRGCWHGVSRCFLNGYRQGLEVLFPKLVRSRPTELYDPKAFIAHAASLRQAFAHCAIFPTAASRRSLDRVSVPVWLTILSDQLPVLALASFYLTNKLMGRRLILR